MVIVKDDLKDGFGPLYLSEGFRQLPKETCNLELILKAIKKCRHVVIVKDDLKDGFRAIIPFRRIQAASKRNN